MNETARKALQANLDYYINEMEDAVKRRDSTKARLAQIEDHISVVAGHIRDLREALNDQREDSTGT